MKDKRVKINIENTAEAEKTEIREAKTAETTDTAKQETKESAKTTATVADQPETGESAKTTATVADTSKNVETEKMEASEPEIKTTQQSGAGEPESSEKRKRGKGKTVFAAAAAILIILVGIYVGVAMNYKTRFLPNTSVNGVDCTGQDAEAVAGILENQLQTYSLTVVGRDYKTGEAGAVLGAVSAADISLTFGENSRVSVDGLLAQQDIFLWPLHFAGKAASNYSLVMEVGYNEEILSDLLNTWDACREENMRESENAYIGEYSEQLKGYEIIPETIGTEFDMETLKEHIKAAILSQQTTLDLEAEGVYADAVITSEDEKLNRAIDEANKMLSTRVVYDWNGEEVILDAEQLKEWVSIEKDEAVLDEDAVKAFVREQALSYDTYGKSRNFVTTHGVELTLPSGYYGWQTDRTAETEALLKLIYAGSEEMREPVYSSKAVQKGMRDIGNSYVEADLTHQHLYLYEDGEMIFETDFVSGTMNSTPGCVTPQGVFGLSYKTLNAILRGGDYATPVTYWMPFYGNYGMHDATWRNAFGGDIYLTNGSHGCLNLPLDAAAFIYEYVYAGSPIICYYYPEGMDPLAQPAGQETTDNPDSANNSEE